MNPSIQAMNICINNMHLANRLQAEEIARNQVRNQARNNVNLDNEPF